MCDNTADDFLLALKFVPDWFVTIKMIKKPYNTFFANDYLPFFDEGFGNVTIFGRKVGINSLDLNNINLDDASFDEDNPKTIIDIKPMAWPNRPKQRKACKKNISRELMPVT